MAAKRYIVLPQYDHVSDEDVEEFADEINREFRPGIEAHVIKVDEHRETWRESTRKKGVNLNGYGLKV
jgi:hypothetical protein